MKLVFPDEFARPVKNRYRSQLTSFSGPSKKYCSLSVKNKKKKKKCCSTAEITKHSVRILSHRTVRPFCSTRLHSLQKRRNQLDRCHRKWRIYDINTLNSQFRRSCLGHRHALARQQEDAFILEVGGMATITVPVPGDEVLRTSNARRFFYSTEASIGLTQCWISSLAVHATRLAFTVP
uniref:Uncharacterized protein n=1 Tax=Oryza rufipogon TaxID=4529 RepID=A0A0E0NJF8_ORYRU